MDIMVKYEEIAQAEVLKPSIVKFLNSLRYLNREKDNINKTIERIHSLKEEIKANAYDLKYHQDDQDYDYKRGFFGVNFVYWTERSNGKGYIELYITISLSWSDGFYWSFILKNKDSEIVESASSVQLTGPCYLMSSYPTRIMLRNLISLKFNDLRSSEKSIYDYRKYLNEIKDLTIKLSYYSNYYEPLEVPKDELNGILKDLDSETFFDASKKTEITDLINSILEIE